MIRKIIIGTCLLCTFLPNLHALEYQRKTTKIEPAGKKELLGLWKQGGFIIEFTSDNNYILYDTWSKRILNLKYNVAKDNEFRLTGRIGRKQYKGSPFLFFFDKTYLSIVELPNGPRKNHIKFTPKEVKQIRQATKSFRVIKDEVVKKEKRESVAAKKIGLNLGCKISGKPKVSTVGSFKRYEYPCGDRIIAVDCNYNGCFDVTPEPGAYEVVAAQNETIRVKPEVKTQKPSDPFVGKFNVDGLSAEGDKYTGKAIIKKMLHGNYEVEYNLGSKFTVKALRNNNYIVIQSPDTPRILLEAQADGSLYGKYAGTAGWERMTRE